MSDVILTNGQPVTPDHKDIDPRTGMQKAYVVLTEEERAKGFVRPVRTEYTHRGIRPTYPTRELTPEEHERYDKFGYVLFEEYPESESSVTGKFWTKETLNSGCGMNTIMSIDIAETYARDPKFYGGTYCSGCQVHLPLNEFVWKGTDIEVGS